MPIPDTLSPQIALLIIVGVIGLTFLFLFFLVGRWRKKSDKQIKELRRDLTSRSATCQELTMSSQQYRDVDQEPYTSRVREYQKKLTELNQETATLQSDFESLQARIQRGAKDPFRGVLGAPAFWYTVNKDIADIRKRLEQSGELIQSTRQTERSINKLGWEVAGQARQVHGLDKQVRMLLDRLRSRNVHGAALDLAVEQEQRAREAIRQIPEEFLRADESALLDVADRESTAQTHRIVAGIQPGLVELHERVKNWDRQYMEADKLVNRMRRVLASLEGSMEVAPESIDLGEYQQRLDGLNIICHNLNATLTRLEVESMPAVIAESTRVLQTAQSMEIDLRQARAQQAQFSSLYAELDEGLKALSAQFAALGTSQVHPVQWDQSQIQLTALSQRVNELGKADKRRDIEKLKQDHAAVEELNEARGQLAEHTQTIAQGHSELLSVLDRPEIRQSREWIEQAQNLAAKVNLYSADNWSRNDGAATYSQELSALDEALGELVFEHPSEAIPENQVGERLEVIRELYRYYMALRARTQRIQERLLEIQGIETRTKERLKVSEAQLNQVGYLVNSNTFLEGSVSGDLKRLKGEVQNLNVSLSESLSGEIEKKAGRVSSLNDKIESTLGGWQAQLDKENQKQGKALADSLATLEAIAPLTDQSLAEARQLLASAPQASAASRKSTGEPGDRIQELKQGSEYWQKCMAARSAVEEIEEPIVDAFSAASQNREMAQDQLEHLKKWLGKQRDWPPTSVSIASETREMTQLEDQWKSVKGTPVNTLALVQRLGDLAAKYQSLAEKAYMAGERIAREHEDIAEQETELEEYARRWQAQWRAHRYSPSADQEIRDLIDGINQEFEGIKKDYKQNRKDYTGVTQAMKLLARRARVAQVTVDESHVLNIDGQVIAFRG